MSELEGRFDIRVPVNDRITIEKICGVLLMTKSEWIRKVIRKALEAATTEQPDQKQEVSSET